MSEPARPGDGLAPALKLAGIAHGYRQGTARLDVLKGVDLEISAGEIVALTGPSGSGKSTLLHITGLLEQATSGDLWLAGQPVSALDDGARTRLRRDRLGFVFQFHHLLPEFSAEENVMLPALIAGRGKAAARSRLAMWMTFNWPTVDFTALGGVLNTCEVTGSSNTLAGAARRSFAFPMTD